MVSLHIRRFIVQYGVYISLAILLLFALILTPNLYSQATLLVLLKQARAAKPGYAPTYRVLGKVHKKLGEHASAKALGRVEAAFNPFHRVREKFEPHTQTLSIMTAEVSTRIGSGGTAHGSIDLKDPIGETRH